MNKRTRRHKKRKSGKTKQWKRKSYRKTQLGREKKGKIVNLKKKKNREKVREEGEGQSE